MKSWKQERLRRKELFRDIKFQRRLSRDMEMMRKIIMADFKRSIRMNILNGAEWIKINKGNNDE